MECWIGNGTGTLYIRTERVAIPFINASFQSQVEGLRWLKEHRPLDFEEVQRAHDLSKWMSDDSK